MKNRILQWVALTILAAGPAILFSGCERQRLETDVRPEILAPETYRDLNRFFSKNGYRWHRLDQGVPPLILKTLPKDLHKIPRASVRKKIFFMSLLPMVLLENREIARERDRLQDLRDRMEAGNPIDSAERQFLESMGEEYELKAEGKDPSLLLEELLLRVDILPPSLVLAQAANESGYGTSRFARLGNNLFGEWTFIQGTGIVPLGRPAGATHEVRRFESVYDSLKSYMHNLNTHGAYEELRKIRHRMRREGESIRGLELARGLTLYSSRGADYVREIRSMIRTNNLSRVSDVDLRPSTTLLPKDGIRKYGDKLLSFFLAGVPRQRSVTE